MLPNIRRSIDTTWRNVPAPTGWSWAMPFSVQRSGNRFRPYGFSVAAQAPTGAGKAYYVTKTGNDGAAGTSWGAALRNVYTAVQKADVDIIYIGTGVYDRGDGWQGIDLVRSCSIYGVGDVTLTGHQSGLPWAQNGTYPAVWQATRSNTQGVFDAAALDAYGDYSKLTLQTSVSDVNANPGSWYIDGSNVVYVRTSNSRQADANVLVMLNAYNVDCVGNITVYLENLKVYGGSNCVRHQSNGAAQTPKLYALNCRFKYATAGNGITLLGVDTAIFDNCESAACSGDGYNYHVQNSIVPHSAEFNCIGRDNGASGDDDNGSSMHDGGSVVRVNGSYYRNKGPNVVDSAHLESWNLGGLAHTSQASSAGARYNFNAAGGSGVTWCDRTVGYGSDYDYVANTGCTLHRRRCIGSITGGAGTVDEY